MCEEVSYLSYRTFPKPSALQDVEPVRTLIYCTLLWLCGLFSWFSRVNVLKQFALFKNIHRTCSSSGRLEPNVCLKSAQNLLLTSLITTLRGDTHSLHRTGPRLVVGMSPRRPLFDPRPVSVEFMVDKLALAQDFLRVLRYSTVSFMPPVLRTHLFINYRCLAVSSVVD